MYTRYVYVCANSKLLYKQQLITWHSYVHLVCQSINYDDRSTACCGLIQVQLGFHPQHELNCMHIPLPNYIYVYTTLYYI